MASRTRLNKNKITRDTLLKTGYWTETEQQARQVNNRPDNQNSKLTRVHVSLLLYQHNEISNSVTWCCQRSSARQSEKKSETTLPPVSSLRTYQAAAWSSITANLPQKYVLTIGHTWMKRASMDTPSDWRYTDHTSHSFCPPCLCLCLSDYDSLSHPLKVLSCKSRKRRTFLLSAEVEQHTPHLTSSCGNRYPGNRQSGDIDNCVKPRWGDFHSCHLGTEHGGYVWWLKMNTVNLCVFSDSDSAFRSFHVSGLSLKQDE